MNVHCPATSKPPQTVTAGRRRRLGSPRRALAAAAAIGAVALAPSAAWSATIPPKTPPGPNPNARAYEMVTPPDKNNRRTSVRAQLEAVGLINPGTASPLGGAVSFQIQFGIIDGENTAFPHVRDSIVARRTPAGWRPDPLNNVQAAASASAALDEFDAASADLLTQAWYHRAYLFADSRSRFGTRIFGDLGGPLNAGWYPWVPSPALADAHSTTLDDSALLGARGERMLRWGQYRGLLGPSDPSLSQDAGAAIYLEEPVGSGDRHLVNECTGTGADATALIAVGPGGTLQSRACPEGSVTDARGAVAGAHFRGSAQPLAGTSSLAMSEDGRSVFFTSPDPTVGGPGQAECDSATGSATRCPAQLFVRRYGEGGERARWISRSRSAPAGEGHQGAMIAGQDAALAGRGVAFEGASSDGRTVFFRTNAPLTPDDPNGAGTAPPAGGVVSGTASNASWDLYRYELLADPAGDPDDGVLTRISGGPDGTADPNTNCARVTGGSCDGGAGRGAALRALSADGRRAYFVTASPIGSASEPWNQPPDGGATVPGGVPDGNTATRNLYLYDAGRPAGERYRFIAELPTDQSAVDRCATLNYASGMPQDVISSGGAFVVRSRFASCVRTTSAGDALVFESAGDLTGGDGDGAGDVHLYDADAHELVRVSKPLAGEFPYDCGSGATCNADLGFAGPFDNDQRAGDNLGLRGHRGYNLAEDASGRLTEVFFESRLRLVDGDSNDGRMDTYSWAPGRGLALISPGDADHDAFYSGNSRDGRDVYFFTSQRLDPREIDRADFDIYDARAGGGFPYVEPAVPCEPRDGACQGSSGAPPALAGVPGSEAFVGEGNPSPTRLAPRRRLVRVAGPTARQRRALARRGRTVLRIRVRGRGRLVVRSRRARNVVRRVRRPGVVRVPVRLTSRSRSVVARRGRLAFRVAVRFRAQRDGVRFVVRRRR